MAITKKNRFEVLKRDKFICQYCGRAAPEVILHVDHIQPVSKGGTDDILNLITSCRDCNLGKKARLLSDNTVITKQKQQLDELQDRREQLELLMEWQKSLMEFEEFALESLDALWEAMTSGYRLTEHGLKKLKRWLKKFGIQEITEAIKAATDQYLKWDEEQATHNSVNVAFNKIPRICKAKRMMKEKPYLKKLYYIRGILRNRLNYVNEWKSVKIMEQAVLAGIPVGEIQEYAKETTTWTDFSNTIALWTSNASEASSG